MSLPRVLRLESDLLARLEKALPLEAPGGVETAALAFGRVAEAHGRRVFVVDGVAEVPTGAYETQEVARLRPNDRQLLALSSRLRGRGTFALLAHTHPLGPDRHSYADDDYEQKVATIFAGAANGAGLVSLLRHPTGWTAREVVDGRFEPIDVVWVVGRPLRRLEVAASEPDPSHAANRDIWARQTLALGPRAPVDLRHLRVGLVGAGGLGLPLADGLIRHGAGSVVNVDFDTVSRSNLSRLPPALESDVGVLKVEVVERLRGVHRSVELVTVARRVEDDEAQRALETCDVLIAATDNHTSRLVAWKVARRARSLFLSAGTDPRLGPKGIVHRVSAYVADLLPTDGCPGCNAFLDAEQMRRESLPRETLENEVRDGYIPGVEQPAMLSWNLIAVGETLSRFLELVVGFGPAPERGQVRRFELLAAPDARYFAHAVRPSAPGCACSFDVGTDLRDVMVKPGSAMPSEP